MGRIRRGGPSPWLALSRAPRAPVCWRVFAPEKKREGSRRLAVRDALLHAGADWWSPGKSGGESVLEMLWDGGDFEAGLAMIRKGAPSLDPAALALARATVEKESWRRSSHPGLARARTEALAVFDAVSEAMELYASVPGAEANAPADGERYERAAIPFLGWEAADRRFESFAMPPSCEKTRPRAKKLASIPSRAEWTRRK